MTPSSPAQVTLLVDGYNIIGAWSNLSTVRDVDGYGEARRTLTETLVNYTALQGYDTQIVFDAHYQNTPSQRDIIHPKLYVCYTDYGQTADSYIERFCAVFRQNPQHQARRLIVATSDRAQQLMVLGYGAEWMSAQQLRQDVETVTHQLRSRQRSSRQSAQRFLASSLKPEAQERLSQMRFGKHCK
jgi:predicted RNA-binding protein with PIN domain